MPKEKEILVFTNKVDQKYMDNKDKKRKKAIKESQRSWFLRLLFVALLALYLLSDYAKVKQISVFGNQMLSKEAILDQSGMGIETRFYGFVPMWVERVLKKNPLIADVKVSRGLHQIVRIDVVEHPVVGYLYQEGLTWLLGDGSLVPVEAGAMDSLVDVPYIDGFDEIPELLPKLAKYLSEVDELTLSLVSEVSLFPLEYDKEQLKLHMIDQNVIYVPMVYLSHINQYPRLINAIAETSVCIFFDATEDRAYTSECLE